MTEQPDLFGPPTGRDLAEAGIRSSAEHAEVEIPLWSIRAYIALAYYAYQHRELTIEEVKAFAYERGLERPPAEGAWGSITRRAVKEHLIEFSHVQESKNASRHMQLVRVWRSLTYPGRNYD